METNTGLPRSEPAGVPGNDVIRSSELVYRFVLSFEQTQTTKPIRGSPTKTRTEDVFQTPNLTLTNPFEVANVPTLTARAPDSASEQNPGRKRSRTMTINFSLCVCLGNVRRTTGGAGRNRTWDTFPRTLTPGWYSRRELSGTLLFLRAGRTTFQR